MTQTGKLLELGEINHGKTFVCGDIHGCYEDLMALLKEVNFDFCSDRLICCGDLIDRGPDSFMCIKLIYEPWFYSVMGNHEDMALQCITNRNKGIPDPWWISNGGQWFYGLDFKETSEFIIHSFCDLPIGIDVKVGGRTYAIMHADPLYMSWGKTKESLKKLNKNQWTNCNSSDSDTDNLFANALWNRDQVDSDITIDGCDLMIHGHTIMKEPKYIGNRLFIDTGSYLNHWDGYTGKISITCLDEHTVIPHA